MWKPLDLVLARRLTLTLLMIMSNYLLQHYRSHDMVLPRYTKNYCSLHRLDSPSWSCSYNVFPACDMFNDNGCWSWMNDNLWEWSSSPSSDSACSRPVITCTDYRSFHHHLKARSSLRRHAEDSGRSYSRYQDVNGRGPHAWAGSFWDQTSDRW